MRALLGPTWPTCPFSASWGQTVCLLGAVNAPLPCPAYWTGDALAGALLAALALGRRVQCTVYSIQCALCTVKCEICSVGGLRRGGAGALQSRLAASRILPFGACHLLHMASRMQLGLCDISQVLLDLQHQLPILRKISIKAIFSISSSPTPRVP